MFLFLKKKVDDEDAPQVAAPVAAPAAPLYEFIPYYSHYDARTLLTKNGEMMQIIKIANNTRGLNYENHDSDQSNVRAIIRQAISDVIKDDRFALWIHTMRKRSPITHGGKLNETFAAHVQEQWQKKARWKYQYHNEIYITLLHDGQTAELMDKKQMKNVFMPKLNRSFRNNYLQQAHRALEQASTGLLQKIRQHYNAEYLAISERMPPGATAPIFYSEPMEFLGTLINLRSQPYPLPDADLSASLCTQPITFGFNALETRTNTGARRFAALLTLKQFQEMPAEATDHILQAPSELIISENIRFVPHNLALKQYKEQKEVFDISGDNYSVKATGLDLMLKHNRKQPTDFCEHQTSIMVLTDEYRQLDEEIRKAHEAFSELGLITIREDVKLEEVFWSQLPGNFEFIRRTEPIAASKIGGFSRLNLFPNGNGKGNHWGDAVTLMPTTVNSPYFFNFHHQDNAHTVLFDFNSFHDHMSNILVNFLLTHSLKYQGKIIIFDRNSSARLFFNKLGGNYHLFPLKAERSTHRAPGLNPFTLEDNPRNRAFLLAWCVSLIESAIVPTEAHRAVIQNALAETYAEAPEQRNLKRLVDKVAALDSHLANAFAPYHGMGEFTGWFDAAKEHLDLGQALNAFSMDNAIKRPQAMIPLFSYLLHRVITSLDGRPTIIVMHEAWHLLENNFFAPRLESLLEMLRQNNVMVICTTQNPAATVGTQTLATLMQSCATKIYLPDDISLDYAAMPFGLSERDSRMMVRMDRQQGDFLLKQNNEGIGLNVNLDGMDDSKAIFANDIKNLIAAGGKFATLPQDW